MVDLRKGQELALVDKDEVSLGRLRMGVGWAKKRNAGFIGSGAADVDLDASAIQFSKGVAYDFAFYNNLKSRDGSVVHHGDVQTGSGEGDDETITVDLGRVHPQIDTIVFIVTSYRGHSLEWVSNAYCRLIDDHDVEVVRFTLTLGVPETGMVMAKICRDGATWKIVAIGDGIPVKIPTDAVTALAPYV